MKKIDRCCKRKP